MPHTPGSATYPTSTMAGDPYPKMPLSGAAGFTAEPQEMPMQATSLGPSVQLPLSASHDPHHHPHHHQQQHHHQPHHPHHAHHQPPPQPQPSIRTQYATYTSAPPHHLTLSAPSGPTTAPQQPPQQPLTSPDACSLAVPRYIGDTNPRPSKSPRHASHQSITSSISNDTTSGGAGEYRYGPAPTTAPTSATSQPQTQGQDSGVVSPHGAAHASLPPVGGSAPTAPYPGDAQQTQQPQPGSGTPSSAAGREYFPSPAAVAQGWTTTSTGATGAPGADTGAANSAGGDRPYGYPAAAATTAGAGVGHAGVKPQDAHHAAAAAAGQGYGYGWNTA